MTSSTAELIRSRLVERFAPEYIELHDDSAQHAGHAGATGGGHFRVVLVAAAFEGLSRLEQHRLVNATLADLMLERVHALSVQTRSPSEWRRDPRAKS